MIVDSFSFFQAQAVAVFAMRFLSAAMKVLVLEGAVRKVLIRTGNEFWFLKEQRCYFLSCYRAVRKVVVALISSD